jgi:hypothetical protein
MKTKYLVMVAAAAVMLIGATAISTTDSVFAEKKKGYEKSQATSQANACGNGEMPLDVFCQNLNSQIQGDENAVTILGNQVSEEQENGVMLPPA